MSGDVSTIVCVCVCLSLKITTTTTPHCTFNRQRVTTTVMDLDETIPMQRDEYEVIDRMDSRQMFVVCDSSYNSMLPQPTTASGHPLEPRIHTLRSHGSADQGTTIESRPVAPRQNPNFWSGTSMEHIPPSADRRSGFPTDHHSVGMEIGCGNLLPISQDVGTDGESTDEQTNEVTTHMVGERDPTAIDPRATTGPGVSGDVREAGNRPLHWRTNLGLEAVTHVQRPLHSRPNLGHDIVNLSSVNPTLAGLPSHLRPRLGTQAVELYDECFDTESDDERHNVERDDDYDYERTSMSRLNGKRKTTASTVHQVKRHQSSDYDNRTTDVRTVQVQFITTSGVIYQSPPMRGNSGSAGRPRYTRDQKMDPL